MKTLQNAFVLYFRDKTKDICVCFSAKYIVYRYTFRGTERLTSGIRNRSCEVTGRTSSLSSCKETQESFKYVYKHDGTLWHFKKHDLHFFLCQKSFVNGETISLWKGIRWIRKITSCLWFWGYEIIMNSFGLGLNAFVPSKTHSLSKSVEITVQDRNICIFRSWSW